MSLPVQCNSITPSCPSVRDTLEPVEVLDLAVNLLLELRPALERVFERLVVDIFVDVGLLGELGELLLEQLVRLVLALLHGLGELGAELLFFRLLLLHLKVLLLHQGVVRLCRLDVFPSAAMTAANGLDFISGASQSMFGSGA